MRYVYLGTDAYKRLFLAKPDPVFDILVGCTPALHWALADPGAEGVAAFAFNAKRDLARMADILGVGPGFLPGLVGVGEQTALLWIKGRAAVPRSHEFKLVVIANEKAKRLPDVIRQEKLWTAAPSEWVD